MLFRIINGKLEPSEFALMVEPFKTMWETDMSEDHKDTRRDWMYIELLCSPKLSNPYHAEPEEVRPAKVKKEIFKDENYQVPNMLMRAILVYMDFLERILGYKLYEASLTAADKLTAFFNNFDLNERTNGGAAVLKPGDITRGLKEVGDTIKGLHTSRIQINQSLEESAKTRGGREIGDYER